MRELTCSELEYISGGTDPENEDIIVTGTPYQPPYYYPPSYYPPSYPPSYYPGYGYPPTPPTDDYCQDQEAMQGADEIEAKPDDNNNEYGSLVYKAADGRTLHSPPLGGTGAGMTLSTFTDWMSANNIAWSQIMGMVHNHPSGIYATSQTEADVNRYPSTNDWNFATYAMQHGAQASFSLYVNDTGGTLREYTNSNRATFEGLTVQQMDDGVDLPTATRACGS